MIETPDSGPAVLFGRPRFDAPVQAKDFRDLNQPVPVSITGVHGGAGTTTVARLLHATDLGRTWPEPADGNPPRVILVARTHSSGLMAASRALAGYHAASHPEGPYLAGFVLVADAPGRLPKPMRHRITILASATMVFRLPWVPAWRLSEVTAGGADRRLAAQLREFAGNALLTATPAMHE